MRSKEGWPEGEGREGREKGKLMVPEQNVVSWGKTKPEAVYMNVCIKGRKWKRKNALKLAYPQIVSNCGFVSITPTGR